MFIFAITAISSVAQKTDPNNGINWPLATGTTTPTLACTTARLGLMYTDLTTTTYYVCMSSGWVAIANSSGTGTVTQVSTPTGNAAVSGVNITSGGTYTACPTGVTFNGGTGSGAVAGTVSCQSEGGGNLIVSNVPIANGGSYGACPTSVTFTGGIGSGATGTPICVKTPDWLVPFVSAQNTTPQIYIGSGSFPGNEFLGSPNGSSGPLEPRAITNADLPGTGTTTINGTPCSLGGTCTPPGGSMTWPTGSGPAIPCYSGTSSWCASFSAANLIPNTFLPSATNSQQGILRPDGTSCTATSGVLSCSGSSGAFANAVRTVTASTSLNTADGTVKVSSGSGVTLTLPGVTVGQAVALINGTGSAVTIAAGGGMSINNIPTTLPANNAFFVQYTSSGNWDWLGATAVSSSGGINQLTGDVTAGPGTGSQVATLATVNAGPGACGDSTHVCVPTTNGKGLVTSQTTAAIPTAAPGTNGLSSPDNTTIKAIAGVETVQPTELNGTAMSPGGNYQLTAAAVGAAQAPDSGIPFAQLANGVIAANHFFFNDGTDGWCAGFVYCFMPTTPQPKMYGSDTILTMLAFPGHFTPAQLLNVVNKFVGLKNAGSPGPCQGTTGTNPCPVQIGDFPESINQDGTVAQWCSGADLYCHLATGDGRIAVPIALYLYWQKTGDLTPYTANVAAIKVAMGNPPRNGITHLMTVTAGQEDIPGIGYLEQQRPLGDVADANVWDAYDAKAMQLMATAAGDATNATFFGNIYTQDVAGITTTLTDSTTKLLFFATGAQMHQLDVVDSTLAAYPILGPAVGPLLPGSQITAIANWINTNYSSVVNANGYAKLVNACDTVGIIPTSGGPPYTSGTFTLTNYQCGYWATFGGYFAYTLGQVNPAQAAVFEQTWLGGINPTAEYYDQGASTPNVNADKQLMTAAQSNRVANIQFPASVEVTTGLCVVGQFGNCTNNITDPLHFAGGIPGVTIPFGIDSRMMATVPAFYQAARWLAPNETPGNYLYNSVGVIDTTNNEGTYGFYYAAAGSANNCDTLGMFGINDLFIACGNGKVAVNVAASSASTLSHTFTVNGDIGATSVVASTSVSAPTVSATTSVTTPSATLSSTTTPLTLGPASGTYAGPMNVPAICPGGTTFDLFSLASHAGSPDRVTMNSCGEMFIDSAGGDGGHIGDTGHQSTISWDGAGHANVPNLGSGTASNSDLNGELTLVSGTASQTFALFDDTVSHPICVANDETAESPVRVTYSGGSGSAWVATFHVGTSSDTINYICTGRAN